MFSRFEERRTLSLTTPPNAQLHARLRSDRRLDAVVRRNGSQRAEETIVLGVRADPEPHDDIAVDDAQRAMAQSHPCGIDGPRGVDALEVETWVMRIVLEIAVGFTGPALDMIG